MTDIRTQLLTELFSHRGDFVSGGVLSERIGVSRVSIKNHMDQLSGLGFGIEAVRNRGYRLSLMPTVFQADAFRLHFGSRLPAAQVMTFESINSTNLELDRRLNLNEPAPMLAVAASQTHGKGRRGNQWESHSGCNLYLSFGFRPNLPISRIGQYTLWVGMQLARFLNQHLGLRVMVKWPNDLYLEGKKLAGILTEAKIDTDHVQHLIVGLGLNINAGLEFFPENLRNKGVSLRMVMGRELEFNELAAGIATTVFEESNAYFASPKMEQIREQWNALDFLAGKQVQARAASGAVAGIAAGIDERGELQIRLQDNTLQTVNSGEVTMAFEN